MTFLLFSLSCNLFSRALTYIPKPTFLNLFPRLFSKDYTMNFTKNIESNLHLIDFLQFLLYLFYYLL